jgi:hypothetical protein
MTNYTPNNKLNLEQWSNVKYFNKKLNKEMVGKLAKVEDSLIGEIYYINSQGICYPVHIKDVLKQNSDGFHTEV